MNSDDSFRSLESMSTNGDASPRDEKDNSESVVSPSVTKGDSVLLQAPSVPGHQDVVDALWPTLMKGVEGMYLDLSYNIIIHSQNDSLGAGAYQATQHKDDE